MKRALDRLAEALGKDKVSRAAADRLAASRDLWPRGLLEYRAGRPAPSPPEAVVWPESTGDVVRVVQWARSEGVALVPYGGGSGVCGGAMPDRGQVVVDLKRLDRVLEASSDRSLARVQAGVLGWTLERELNRRGLTLGHFPSSIFCSTVGGWLAARSAGQCSSRYGKIEDLVAGLEVVAGTGRVYRLGLPGGATAGPDWIQVFVGSEGTLGIFTEASLKVHRLPEVQLYRGFEFASVAAGLEAIRRIMQRGLRPSVLRLYDEFDTVVALSDSSRGSEADDLLRGVLSALRRLSGPLMPWLKGAALRAALKNPMLVNRLAETLLPQVAGKGCLLVAGCEGTRRLAEVEMRAVRTEASRARGKDLGPGPGEHWARHRYSVSFKQSGVFYRGGFVDTMEVATTWDRIYDLYLAVREAVGPLAFIMAHFSHAYEDGCSVYFTFAGLATDPQQALRLYDEVWQKALAAVSRAGGAISHHHGIGRSKQSFMLEEHGRFLDVYRALKSVLDPDGILNPGKMGLAPS